MSAVRDQLNGIFYKNSRTRFADIRDGKSETIIVGERSTDTFDSTWLAVVERTHYTGWRVVGWTGEPPNHPGNSLVHFHAYAQFNSYHPGVVNFAFVDGSVRPITDTIEQPIFKAMGTINGGEKIGEY
jgi:prepilin-type processing-associated H-X9-DG protein